MDVKNIQFTEKDFEMLVEGLEALPNRNVAGEFMGDLMLGLIDKSPEAHQKLEQERKIRAMKQKQEKATQLEDIRLLQAKLIQFKRYLLQIDALTQAYDILEG